MVLAAAYLWLAQGVVRSVAHSVRCRAQGRGLWHTLLMPGEDFRSVRMVDVCAKQVWEQSFVREQSFVCGSRVSAQGAVQPRRQARLWVGLVGGDLVLAHRQGPGQSAWSRGCWLCAYIIKVTSEAAGCCVRDQKAEHRTAGPYLGAQGATHRCLFRGC